MKKSIFLLFVVIIACGGSSEGTQSKTLSHYSKSSTTTAIISDTASTEMKIKINPRILIQKFIFDKDSFPGFEWSQSFELIEMDKSCINNSSFNPNSNFSVDAKINFENIFKVF